MKYIAIEGKSGSGKTYLSNALAKKLNCKILHLDDFGNDFEPFIGIQSLLKSLTTTKSGEVLIYEGVGVFKDDFVHLNSFRIFVDTPEDVRKVRAESRDVPTSERSKEDWQKIYEIWDLAETEYFTDEVKKKAHLITGKDGDFDIEKIITAYTNFFSSK